MDRQRFSPGFAGQLPDLPAPWRVQVLPNCPHEPSGVLEVSLVVASSITVLPGTVPEDKAMTAVSAVKLADRWLMQGSMLHCLASALLSHFSSQETLLKSAVLLLCRSLLERALRMRLVYAQPAMTRALSFEYLNRQLVWHELSELLLFLLPLLNVGAVTRFLTQRLRPPSTTAIASGVGLVVR